NLSVRHDDPTLAFEAKHSESCLAVANATAIVEPCVGMLSCGRSDRANSRTMIEQAIERLWVLGPTALVGFALSFALMLLLRPWLARYAMVRPNPRSSHHQPTPQGGGI